MRDVERTHKKTYAKGICEILPKPPAQKPAPPKWVDESDNEDVRYQAWASLTMLLNRNQLDVETYERALRAWDFTNYEISTFPFRFYVLDRA